MTRTYALLDISEAAYSEIRAKLEAAGYGHAFHHAEDEPETVDMHGIALRSEDAVKIYEAAAADASVKRLKRRTHFDRSL